MNLHELIAQHEKWLSDAIREWERDYREKLAHPGGESFFAGGRAALLTARAHLRCLREEYDRAQLAAREAVTSTDVEPDR